MGSIDEVSEADSLERGLLAGSISNEYREDDEGTILYSASFEELEDNYLRYQTAQWVLYSLLLILAWGIGALMLLYLPVRRYILRKEFQSRKLYVTPTAIVYKVTRPVVFPCFGVLKKEKYVLLPSVADIVVEQGYLQSLFGIYSVRIENAGVRKPASDDVKIQGIAHPGDFRKAILVHLSNIRGGSYQQTHINEDPLSLGSGPRVIWHPDTAEHEPTVEPTSSRDPPFEFFDRIYRRKTTPSRSLRRGLLPSSGELILQKIEEIINSVKRVQNLIEKQDHAADSIV